VTRVGDQTVLGVQLDTERSAAEPWDRRSSGGCRRHNFQAWVFVNDGVDIAVYGEALAVDLDSLLESERGHTSDS